MGTDARRFTSGFIDPNVTHFNLRDLPISRAVRWTSRLKADVVQAVHRGLLSLSEASERYALSREEFRTWEIAHDVLLRQGLRVETSHPAERNKRKSSVHLH
jgi:hypothetical protein